MEKLDELIQKGIYALLPAYVPAEGNATKIITADGNTYIDNRVVKTVLKALCRYYAVHVEHCREKYGKLIHQRLHVPLPIHRDLLLIPMKVRKPMFRKDGACGYINLYAIDKIKEKGDYSIFVLKNGIEVECLQRLRTVHQHINHARLVEKHAFFHGDGEEGHGAVEGWWEAYDAPATKGDIVLLKKEIVELVQVLKKTAGTKKDESYKKE